MNAATGLKAKATDKVETFDVLIVGAGISGVGSACHLQEQCPDKSYVILETLETFGGTWATHTYPGIRSDSDLFTFGYRFKPWVGAPIATADEILRYMQDVIEEHGVDKHIRYGWKITTADWSEKEAKWTVSAHREKTGETLTLKANFLWMCQGYYRQGQGYTPTWDGMADYKGKIVHPQTWPDDLDYKDKKVIVIGSGATAATVIPAIAGDCAHVTMVQRSPTYFIPGQNVNELAELLRPLEIPDMWVHEIVRRKILYDQNLFTQRSFLEPEAVKAELLEAVKAYVGEDIVKEHFTPTYRPWRQRIAFVPDGDIFKSVLEGKASVVTDEIERFTEKGLKLKSGKELEADIIVTATGFNLNVLGDIAFSREGQPIDLSKTVTYRGMLFTDVPNLVWVFGYFRASWTLRVDIMGDFVCRLLKHMQKKGMKTVEVAIPEKDADMEILPWIDPENFNPGYLLRGMHLMPKRGSKPQWAHTQDYWLEKKELPAVDLDGPEFVYR